MSLKTVREAFKDLFNDIQIRSISPKAYDYDVIYNSNLDNRKFRAGDKVNYFTYIITKSIEFKTFRCTKETYLVELKYYKEDEKEGKAQNDIRDAFETIHSRINTVIGSKWNNTVDFYQPISNEIAVQTIQVGDQPSWLGTFSYQGIKQI